MRTNALIKQIQRDAPQWSVEDIRELINEVQRYVYSNPTHQMRMYDTTTGYDPTLTTTSGTYEYTINTDAGFPFNAQSVYRVYSTKGKPDDYEEIEVISGTETTAAKVRFTGGDPGDSTFYVWCYRKPPEVSSATTQLTIPPQYHLTMVKMGVLGLIETSDSGVSRQWQQFEEIYRKKFLVEQNTIAREFTNGFIIKKQGF